jgi:hypothetical protein
MLNVLQDGTRTESSDHFTGCPNDDVLGSPVYGVIWAGGNRTVTIRVGDQINVWYDSDALYLPGGHGLCFVQSAGGYGGEVDTLQAVRPGSQIVFENRTTHIEVIKIIVAPGPPIPAWAVALVVIGAGLAIGGAVMLIVVYSRRYRARPL